MKKIILALVLTSAVSLYVMDINSMVGDSIPYQELTEELTEITIEPYREGIEITMDPYHEDITIKNLSLAQQIRRQKSLRNWSGLIAGCSLGGALACSALVQEFGLPSALIGTALVSITYTHTNLSINAHDRLKKLKMTQAAELHRNSIV